MPAPAPSPNRHRTGAAAIILRGLKWLGWAFAWFVALGCTLWAFGALRYDFPVGKSVGAWVFVLVVIAAIIFMRGAGRKLGATFGAFVIVLGWWLTLQPTNTAAWLPDVAQTAWAEINGDEVTLHNVRNCDYRTETDYTPHWETRTVRLSQITGVDLAIDYWGSPWIAHPIASFQFADAPPVCFSIETRKKVGQTYSAIGGLYRQFELIYLVSDERDVIRLRTNYRGEDIYLYRTVMTPAQARERFLEYLRSLNQIREHPRWYNAVTTNCTTSIRTQHPAKERLPWDWRMLVNGKGDEMMYERHRIITDGLPFAELRKRALINDVAKAADKSPEFSRVIREDRPGFATPPGPDGEAGR